MPDVFVADTKPKDTKVKLKPKNMKAIKKYSRNPLSSFALYPDPAKSHFETREDDEEIILILRQHPIINVKWILISLFMLIAPLFIGSLGLFTSIPAGFGIVLSLCWYLVTIAYMLESFMSWYFNVYIVTDRRIVDVDFYNLIYKQVSDAQLDKIEDVTYSMGGVVRTLFNYGNITIQTAGEINQFEFNAVPQPDKVAKIIQDLMTP